MVQFLLILLYPALVLSAWQPDWILRVSNDTIAADCTSRRSTIVNGTSPGPTIRVKEGDHLWIRVYNDMLDSNTTMHWHGISQFMSPFADGTPQTSQWPIAPQNYFDYEFKLDKGSAGTYMYHTHIGFQVVTSYGAFIVEDASPPPYKYDDDLILMLGDFYYASDYNVTAGLLGAPFVWPNDPQALTVNGNAFGVCNASTSVCETGCHTDVVYVKPSTTYRVRVIGITALSFIYMAIEDHPGFELIEVDSEYIIAHHASHLEVSSGQRYSFLLKTKSVEEILALNKTTFWANIETRWRATRDQGAWLLKYSLAPGSDLFLNDTDAHNIAFGPIPPNLNQTVPLPNEEPFWVMPELAPLHASDEPPPDEEVSRRIFVDMQQLSTGNGTTQKIFWDIDQHMYSEDEPLVPFLVQAYEAPGSLQPNYSVAIANRGYDTTTDSIPIRLNETVDMVFLNLASFGGKLEAHPWHIHGQHPYVMAQGLGNFSDDAYNAARKRMTGRPIRRDTNIIFAGPKGAAYTPDKIPPGQNGGWMVFRMKAAVTGAFLLHCHLAPHLIMGMATVLLVGIEDLPQLPQNFTQEYATYNATPRDTPQSFFERYPHRQMIDSLVDKHAELFESLKRQDDTA